MPRLTRAGGYRTLRPEGCRDDRGPVLARRLEPPGRPFTRFSALWFTRMREVDADAYSWKHLRLFLHGSTTGRTHGIRVAVPDRPENRGGGRWLGGKLRQDSRVRSARRPTPKRAPGQPFSSRVRRSPTVPSRTRRTPRPWGRRRLPSPKPSSLSGKESSRWSRN